MKGFADEMAAARKAREEDDFISYVLAGLDHDYNSIENVTGKTEISLEPSTQGCLLRKHVWIFNNHNTSRL
jgi:hypothetical protein